MFKFDQSKLHIEFVKLKSCSTALGGSIRVLDEVKSTPEHKIYKKINIPFAVARSFQQTYEKSEFVEPVVTALTYYGDHVVCVERHTDVKGQLTTKGFDGEDRMWIPRTKVGIDNFLLPLLNDGREWYIDGKYVYTFGNSSGNNTKAYFLEHARPITSDGTLRSIECIAFDLSDIAGKRSTSSRSTKKKRSSVSDKEWYHALVPESRACYGFVVGSIVTITPPLTKQLAIAGNAITITVKDENNRVTELDRLEMINDTLYVNVAFALRTSEIIGNLWGYEMVEPLRLDNLIVELGTVNIPALPKSVKNTKAISMDFVTALSWLIGMINRCTTLNELMEIKSCISFLLTRGCFEKTMFDTDAIFKNAVPTTVHMKSEQECLAAYKSDESLVSIILRKLGLAM